jgi:hypothetical protein
MQQIAKTHIPQKLSPNPVGNPVHYLRSVIRRINVHPEGSLAKGHVDNPYNRIRHFSHIGIRKSSACETLHYFLA